MPLAYDTAVERLIEEFPEFRDACLAALEWLGNGRWVYLIFGLVVNPFLVEALESGQNEPLVRRVFNFVERMASSEDEDLQTVAAVSVCERLSGMLEFAYPYMGPATRQLSDEIEEGWNPSKHGGASATPKRTGAC